MKRVDRSGGTRGSALLILAGMSALSASLYFAIHAAPRPEVDQGIAVSHRTIREPIRVVGFGHVDVEGGIVPLSPSLPGRVMEILVAEGERVVAGQPLVRLQSEQARGMVEEAEASLEQAEIQRRQAERAAEEQSLTRRLQLESIQAAESKLAAQIREVEQIEELAKSSVVPNEKLHAGRELVDELQALLNAERLKLQKLELQDPGEVIELAQSGLKLAAARLAQAREQLAQHTLIAPTAGTALRKLVSVGQMSQPSSPALWFAPDRPKVVRCEIDQAYASQVSTRMKAEIYDDRLEGSAIAGVVESCGDWIAQRRSILDEPFQKNDVRTLECMIKLTGDAESLRVGQRMRVILIDEGTD